MTLTPERVRSILKPKIYTTDDFESDSISFNIDDRFRNSSLVRQLEIKSESERDGTGKLMIDFGKLNQQPLLSIKMFSPTYYKSKTEKHIVSDFTEFTAPTVKLTDFTDLGTSQSDIDAVDDYLAEEV